MRPGSNQYDKDLFIFDADFPDGGSEFRLLAAVGRASDVARGPRALKDGLPAYSPPFAHFSGHNLPVHPVLPGGAAARQKQGGAGGELFLTLQESGAAQPPVCSRHAVLTQSLHDARRAYGGSEFRLLAAIGRAPDVARGPRALRDGLPAYSPPFRPLLCA